MKLWSEMCQQPSHLHCFVWCTRRAANEN